MADTKFFSNAETEAKFESVFGVDKRITLPGKYSGMLSNIPPDIAQALIDMKDNQVKAKTTTPVKTVTPAGPAGGDPK